MSGRPLQDLHSHRRVRTRIADHPGPEAGQHPFGVAARPVGHPDRMALGVHQERFLARQRALHGPLQQPGCQSRVGLVGHVLLAAEGPTIGHQLDGYPVSVDAEHRRDLVAVVPDALPAGVDVQSTVTCRHGEGGLGLHEGVLNALGLEDLVDDVGRPDQGGLDVAAGVRRHRKHVSVQFPDSVLVSRKGHHRVAVDGQRRQLDVDQHRRPTGGLPVIGHDHGQHVSQVGGPTTLRDHHRPVRVDDPHPVLPRYVGGREHPLHTVDGFCCRGVDPHHVGTGVVGEAERCVQQALRRHVVDEGAVSEAQLGGLHLHPAGPDAAAGHGHRDLARCKGFDCIQNLHVAGAPAEVGAQVAGRMVTGQGGALLVHEGLGAHDDARRAEAALQGAMCGEGTGVTFPLSVRQALQGRDRATFGLLHRRLAGDPGLPVDQHGAATALTRRRAAVLGRGDAQFVAQGGQQVGVVNGGIDRPPVQLEARYGPSPFGSALDSTLSSRAARTPAGTSGPRWAVIRP